MLKNDDYVYETNGKSCFCRDKNQGLKMDALVLCLSVDEKALFLKLHSKWLEKRKWKWIKFKSI